ncbi:hypothetical protein J1605_012622 [Eschrichtius robustus]|uniref:Rab-GAP TBC domain-containing protein n=1 Tax=Eschrichtius robustus TaxID=9764 RepID=A0AB34GLY7_ESCRO|nr:hypothetical protein J1605_001247 [Eschrichtius robustus]KAJ8779419.1 hypothetical protein J1605_012622 [Eschrichtius robustus]
MHVWVLQEVGYCRGMSQVVAVLPMFLSEEDAFWALVWLTTDEKHAMHGMCLPWTAGCASRPGVSMQSSPGSGAGGTPAQSISPSAKGTGSPHCPVGPGATAVGLGLVQTTLPSLLVLLPHARTPFPPAPSDPTVQMKPRQVHQLLCPQPGCPAQETAKHSAVTPRPP